MVVVLRSIWVWFSISVLILIWAPITGVVYLFDRDPGKYLTGRWFRRLGSVMTRANPLWRIRITGDIPSDMRRPFLVVGNHQSVADIPVLSRLPWDMKWVGKESLFRLPVLGLMMRLSRDIAVDREDRRSRARVFLQAGERFRNRVSVIIFPEGTRSPDGRVRAFSKGPFSLALREHIAILPIAVDGTFDALPKRSWKFRVASDIRIHVFEPVELAGWEHDADGLRRHVRTLIVEKIAAWRGVPVSEVDATRMAFIPVPTSV